MSVSVVESCLTSGKDSDNVFVVAVACVNRFFTSGASSPAGFEVSGLIANTPFRFDGRGVGVGGNAADEPDLLSDFSGDFFDSQEESAIDRTKAAIDQPVNRRNDLVF